MELIPTRAAGNPKDVVTRVLVPVLQERLNLRLIEALPNELLLQFLAALREFVRDVLEEHEPEHNVLVFRGLLVPLRPHRLCSFP